MTYSKGHGSIFSTRRMIPFFVHGIEHLVHGIETFPAKKNTSGPEFSHDLYYYYYYLLHTVMLTSIRTSRLKKNFFFSAMVPRYVYKHMVVPPTASS